MRVRVLAAALMLVIGIGAVVFVVFRPGSASGSDAQYLTSAVARTTVTDSVAANGTLQPVTRYGLSFGAQPQTLTAASSASSSNASSSSASNGASATSWPVTSVKVSVGQAVKKGALLAAAGTASITEQLSQLSDQLTVAEIQLAQAAADLDAATSDQQTRQAQIAYYNAKGQVAQLTAQRTDLNAQLARASITAPADGIVEQVNVVAGADAPSGSAIVLDAGGLEASVTIAEADLSRISKGQTAVVTISAVGGSATGTVASIAPTASTGSGNNAVVTYGVTLTLADVPATARAGMTASVAITISTASNVLAVPAIALQTTANGYSVRVMNADGTVSTRDVEVGLVTSNLAQITSGLTEGEEVVIGVSTTRTSTGTTNGNGFGGLGGALGGGGAFRGGGGGPQIQTR